MPVSVADPGIDWPKDGTFLFAVKIGESECTGSTFHPLSDCFFLLDVRPTKLQMENLSQDTDSDYPELDQSKLQLGRMNPELVRTNILQESLTE